jgi:predicted nucleotide-binding protein
LRDSMYLIDAEQDTLDARVIEPWSEGRPIVMGGRTVLPAAIEEILIFETDAPVQKTLASGFAAAVSGGRNRTDDLIAKAAGGLVEAVDLGPGIERNPKRVMIVHGRNEAARDAVRAYLVSLGLEPIGWEEAIEETGEASPHNLVAVTASLEVAQAVVVIFTAEDEARLIERFRGDGDDDQLRGQPRPNVFLEAGMALSLLRHRTILVRLGAFRNASDLDGLNAINMSDGPLSRAALRRRLKNAECAINDREDYLDPSVAGSFEQATLDM